jgi:hypothetical protein
MPKFITIGYGDQAGYDRTPRSVRDAAHQQDAKLRSEGALMGIAGTPVQVRNPDGARPRLSRALSCHQPCQSPDSP